MKGLDTANLKITKILANKASIPMTGGRHRRGTKRTHLELEVREFANKKKGDKKIEDKKIQRKAVQPVSETAAAKVKTAVFEKNEKKEPVSVPEKVSVAASSPAVEQKKAEPKKMETVSSKIGPRNSESLPKISDNTKVKLDNQKIETKLPEMKEPSSQELLAMAQKRAAELNKRQRQDHGVKEVENLYEQLQKKGSLRSSPGGSRVR